MKKRLLSLCFAVPVLVSFAGCDSSDAPTAPGGGKKVEQSKDIAPEKAPDKTAKKPSEGTIFAPN